MIRLQTVQENDRELLWNINQKYLYEMTNFYNEKNVGAKKLWSILAAPYEPEAYHMNEEEPVLLFEKN